MLKKIVFGKLSPELQKAFLLLHKVRQNAILGVGYHTEWSCPIAAGYSIEARLFWQSLKRNDRQILSRNGWNPGLFGAFVDWYDCVKEYGYNRKAISFSRDNFLREFLRQDVVPKISY